MAPLYPPPPRDFKDNSGSISFISRQEKFARGKEKPPSDEGGGRRRRAEGEIFNFPPPQSAPPTAPSSEGALFFTLPFSIQFRIFANILLYSLISASIHRIPVVESHVFLSLCSAIHQYSYIPPPTNSRSMASAGSRARSMGVKLASAGPT